MSGWYIVYLVICVVNSVLLSRADFGLEDPTWWLSNLCVIGAFIVGQAYEESK